MAKYIVVQDYQRFLRLVETKDAWYTPAGWHRPYKYHEFGDWNLNHAKVSPAEKRTPQVTISGLVTKANNARVMDDATATEIDAIDAQLIELRKHRQQVIKDRFLTFRLVQDGDLPRSHTEVFDSKGEAAQVVEGK